MCRTCNRGPLAGSLGLSEPAATFCASSAAAASAGTPPPMAPPAAEAAVAETYSHEGSRPVALASAALAPSFLGALCCATAAMVSSGKMRRLCRSKKELTILSSERRASSSWCGSETTK